MSRLSRHRALLYQMAAGSVLLLAACGSPPQRTVLQAALPTATVAGISTVTVSPTATSRPAAAPSVAPTMPATGLSATLPPGSPLPSEAECAARVHRSPFEPRPDNTAANNRVPTTGQLAGMGTWDGSGCYQSYGVMQIKWYYFQGAWPMSRDDTAFNVEYVYGILRACYEGWTTYLADGTPLPGYPHYAAGDLWGCLGRWYSGWWYTQGAVDYIAKVKAALAQQTWLSPNF